MRWISEHSRTTLLIGLALAGLLQLISGNLDVYYLNIGLMAAIHVALAVSLNLVNGYTGQFSLGHAGFMAVGAYTAASLTTILPEALPAIAGLKGFSLQLWFVFSTLVGGGAAALCGFLVGMPSLRLRGDYLAIVTLGFGEIIRVFIQSSDTLGGARGLSGLPPLTSPFTCVSLAVISIYICGNLVKSTYGLGYLATRDDEIAAESVGVNTTRCKVNAFVVGAFIAGMAGSLYGHLLQYINPSQFGFLKSIEIVVLVILGGMGSTLGVSIAAVVMTFGLEQMRNLNEWRMVIYALLIIVFMIVRPQGVMGTLGVERSRTKSKRKAA